MKGTFALLLLLYSAPRASAALLKVINEAMLPIDLFWLGGRSAPVGSPVRQNAQPIGSRGGIDVESFEDHMFRVKFTGDYAISGLEVDFVKRPEDETIVVALDNATGALTLRHVTARDLQIGQVAAATELCGPQHKDGFPECVADQLYRDIDRIETSFKDLRALQSQKANRLRNYTCSDPAMPTTEPIRREKMQLEGEELEVETFLDTKNAKIFAIPNFVSDSECDVLMRHGQPRLRRATVAALDGSSVVSESRKAQQASYDEHMIHGMKDPLWPLYSRILNVTNIRNGYSLTEEGQEGFTIIQYNPGDEYVNHCDADCGGEQVTVGGRIATAVLYCKVPEIGGATSFSNADVFVNPVKGTATFFSYMNAESKEMDYGLTEHSGCPVFEGEKWIAVTWMRYGVTKERPHSILDPSGDLILSQ